MDEVKSTNIQWHLGEIPYEKRVSLLRQRGGIVWFTGLSGSGKSTLARRLEARLLDKGVFCVVLDGDNLRHGLNRDLGFVKEDRVENIRRVREVALLMAASNLLVVTAFISPYRRDRDAVRDASPPGSFYEVHLATSAEACAARDPKGLYKKAFAGEISDFTGVSAPYEAPEEPELVLDTALDSLDVSVERVLSMLKAAGNLGGRDE